MRSGLNADLTKRGGRWESDFVWNSDVKRALEFQDSVQRQKDSNKNGDTKSQAEDPRDKGFLSLTSKVDLNSMDVDLSEQLKPRKRSQESNKNPSKSGKISLAAKRAALAQQQQSQLQQRGGGYAAVPPTRGESRSWDRSGRYARKAPVFANDDRDMDEEKMKAMEAERQRYENLKLELQTWASVMTAIGLGATYAFYGRDIAASYGVGAVGGLVYLRLLNRTIDGMASGGLGAALGQPRLLIPVILALGYNRYNELLSAQSGMTLQLLPMLVGFFTYKLAAIGRESVALFEELKSGYDGGNHGGEIHDSLEAQNSDAEIPTDGVDVQSVDRAFRKKIING